MTTLQHNNHFTHQPVPDDWVFKADPVHDVAGLAGQAVAEFIPKGSTVFRLLFCHPRTNRRLSGGLISLSDSSPTADATLVQPFTRCDFEIDDDLAEELAILMLQAYSSSHYYDRDDNDSDILMGGPLQILVGYAYMREEKIAPPDLLAQLEAEVV